MTQEIIASGSRMGPKHSVNQDRCAHWRGDELVIALVADGVGGHQAGERASWLVVETFVRHLGVVGFGNELGRIRGESPPGPVTVSTHLPRPVQWAEAILREANDRILDESSTQKECSGMASTVVVMVIDQRTASYHLLHVGDSRAYSMDDGELVQLTEDHSSPSNIPGRRDNVVTRALGAHLVLPVEISPLRRAGFEYSSREVLLLCSDGISGVVDPNKAIKILENAGDKLSGAVEKMLVEVERRHGNDDASVVLVMPDSGRPNPSGGAPATASAIPPPPPPPPPPRTPKAPPPKTLTPGALPPPPPPRVTPPPAKTPQKPPAAVPAVPSPAPPVPRPTLEPPAAASIAAPQPPPPAARPQAPAPVPRPLPTPVPPAKKTTPRQEFPPEPPTIEDEPPAQAPPPDPKPEPEPEPEPDEYPEMDDDPQLSGGRSWVIPALIVVVVITGLVGLAIGIGWFVVNHEPSETTAVAEKPTAPVVMPSSPPVWIDDRGASFRIGLEDPCPDGAWCLPEIGLAGDPLKALATLDGQPTAGNMGTRLERFLDSSRFLMDADNSVVAWHPSRSGTFEPACSRLFPDQRPWVGGLGPGAAGLQPPSGTSLPAAGYRMSSLAADLVGACAVGSRSWRQLMGALLSAEQPMPSNPATGLYRRRLAEGLELALLSASMPEADELRLALETVAGEPIAVRLPSDPLVTFDGTGPFAMGSGFRREIGALATLASQEPTIALELCVVASPAVGRTRKTGPQWDAERLGYLNEAIAEAGAESRIQTCETALEPVTLTDEELLTCGALVAPVAKQGLLLMSIR